MKFLCVLCFICGWSCWAAALDREAFTFMHYDLDARIEPAQQRLAVRGKITLRNDSDVVQGNLALQISSTLNWLSIQIEGQPVPFLSQLYTSDIDHSGALTEAIVTLHNPVAPKTSITVDVGYEGVIPQDATRLTRIGTPADLARNSDWDQIGRTFTAVRGIGYVAWYPVATEAANLSEDNSVGEAIGRWKQRERQADLRVKLQLVHSSENSDIVLCGGDGIEPGAHATQSRECTFSDLSIAVPFFVVGAFGVLEKPIMNIYYLPEHKSHADDYALAVNEVSPFIEQWLGNHRKPSAQRAEVIELPNEKAGPFDSSAALLIPLAANEHTLLMSAVQQVTHVLFPSPRPWIRDGLERYAQLSFLQEKEGRDAAIEYLGNHRAALIESEKPAADAANETAHSLINCSDDFFVQIKAMQVWSMLRDMVGETALATALHSYKSEDDTSPSYMQKLIEVQAHRDLEWFFDDWVYRDRGLPEFRVASVYLRQLLNGGYMATVTVENTGGAAAEVPVTLRMAKGDAAERLMMPAKSSASVRIVCLSLPLEAVVNDGSVPESDGKNNVYKIEGLNH